MKLLIAGIDPGTTLGYTILDLEGNIIVTKSSKLLDLNSLISELIKFGNPIAIGTDRKDIPNFIGKLATKLGAKVITSDKDMPVGFKQTITKEYKKNYRNDHERDALAGALYAFKKLSPLITKIDLFVQKQGKTHLRDDLINIVFRNNLPMALALELLESPEKSEIKIIQKAIDEKKFDADFMDLYTKLKRAKKETSLIKEQNLKLKKYLHEQRKKYIYLENKLNHQSPNKKARVQLNYKEGAIQQLSKEIEFKNNLANELQDTINTLNRFISKVPKNVLVKKLKNLGMDEFQNKSKILSIQPGDLLMVDNPAIVSQNVINLITNNVLIHKSKPSVLLKDKFILIDSAALNLTESKHFAIVSKEDLEKQQLKKQLLSKIVQDYKKSRI